MTRKLKPRKLPVRTETVRNLSKKELSQAAGAVITAQTGANGGQVCNAGQ